MADCPRRDCKGQLLAEPWEQNLWVCLLCARHFRRLRGRFLDLHTYELLGELAAAD